MKIKKKKIYKKHNFLPKKKVNKLVKELRKNVNKIPLNSIISIDETSIDTEILNSSGWGKSGNKICKTFTKQRIRYTLICAINEDSIIHYKLVKNSVNAKDYTEFTKELLSKLDKNKQYYLLQDNARIHHSKIYKDYINNINNANILYSVPYNPQFNPIEYVFNDIKHYLRSKIITNKNIKNYINLSIKQVKSKNVINYFKKSLSF
jgi:putative transposase